MYNSNLTGLQADGIFGEIHVHDNLTSQAIPNGATYTKLNVWSDNGPSKGVIPNKVTGEITLPSAGIYKIEGSLSFRSGTGNVVHNCSVFLDGIEQDNDHFSRKVAVANDVGSASVTGFVVATAGQVVDIRMSHDDASPVDVTINYGNLNVQLANV
jgi:hypothetical protein